MNDQPEWFAPKRYGYGAGLPISWQGWLVLAAYFGGILLLAVKLGERPLQMIASVIPLTAAFIIITAKTTRGGWRWRWGEED